MVGQMRVLLGELVLLIEQYGVFALHAIISLDWPTP